MKPMTLVTTLDFDDDVGLDEALMDKCNNATDLGYRLASVFQHLDRLVLVLQLNEKEIAEQKNRERELLARTRV